MSRDAKDTLFIICLLIFVVASMYSMYVTFENKRTTIVVDCRVVDTSPDFPPELRQRCREQLYRRGR